MTLAYLIGISAILLVGLIVFFVFRARAKRAFKDSLSQQIFLVKIPKEENSSKEFKMELGRFEEFLSSLGALNVCISLEIAVSHVGEEIHFYVAVPRAKAEAVQRQILSIWSGASVEMRPDDYNIFNPKGIFVGAYLLQKENYVLPLRTYSELNLDSFEAILGSFSRMNEIGEGAAMQIVLRPAPRSVKKNIERYIAGLKSGEKFDDVLGKSSAIGFGAFTKALFPEKKDEEEKKQKVVDEASIQSLSSKISKPLFEVNIRVLTSSNLQAEADGILDSVMTGFNQFGSPQKNEFKAVKPKNAQKLAYDFIFRNFNSGQSMILSSEEIASLYHFPISTTNAPRVKWLKSKEAPPPPNLPKVGTLLGQTDFRGEKRPVYVTDEDRGRHLYMIGQTGTGKSTLLASMMLEDIENGKGVALIDPHGELAETILSRIPEKRVNDLIYFDPSDTWKPLGLNMLDYNPSRPEEKTFIVNEMQSIFNKLFTQETMGPMFEQYMRNALLLLMEDMANEPATLVEVPRVFTDPEYRKRKLDRIQNPVVIDFWEKEAAKAGGEASLANMTPYITSKFNNFISNDYMRPIIGQPKSSFNFREAMDSGKILLINLSKGRIGDINANLLGMIITGKILMSALSRVDIPDEKKRREFYLYIDEFQNFTTDSIPTIFSEARKYRLSLTVAHQFINQLDDKVRDAVFGNVGSILSFRVGAQDAEVLVKQFGPTFNENDLINIDNLNAYLKLLINGTTSTPFNIKVNNSSWRKGSPESAAKLKELSRSKYGKDRQDIEKEIHERLRG